MQIIEEKQRSIISDKREKIRENQRRDENRREEKITEEKRR